MYLINTRHNRNVQIITETTVEDIIELNYFMPHIYNIYIYI